MLQPDAGRSSYLLEISEALWPAPASVTIEGSGSSRSDTRRALSEFLLLPDAVRPRLLVPLPHRRAAAAAVRRYGEHSSRRARGKAVLLSAAMRCGLAGRVFRDRLRVLAPEPGGRAADTIETYLSASLGRPLVVSLHVGPARANRKPVLQLLSPGGETFGFAKVATNDLTRDLGAAERAALDRLSRERFTGVTVPELVHHGTWQGFGVLVLSALPVWRRRVPSSLARRMAAMREISEIGGVRHEPLAHSAYWKALASRAARVADQRPAVSDALRAVEGHSTLALPFGAWHGDWTQGNMAVLPETVLLWDWERFSTGVPVGFDPLHWELQRLIVQERCGAALAVERCSASAADLLARLGVRSEQAPLVMTLYLLEIVTRYLTDGQGEIGAQREVVDGLLRGLVTQALRLEIWGSS